MALLETSYTRTIVETVGVLAIVGSLIFVGVQLKQDRLIAEATQHQARAEMSLGNRRATLESETALTALAKLRSEGFDSLGNVEKEAVLQMSIMRIVVDQNNYHQYQLGLLGESYWAGARKRIKDRLREDAFRSIYSAVLPSMDENHALLVNEMLTELDSETQ